MKSRTFRGVILNIIATITVLATFGCSVDEEDISPRNVRVGSLNTPLENMVISWESTSDEDLIKLGYTKNYEMGETTILTRSSDINYYMISDVNANHSLYYSIFDEENQVWGDGYKITTGNSSQDQFSFCFGGDSQQNYDIWGQISNNIPATDFFLFLGDVVQNGNSNSQWNKWFEMGAGFLSRQLVYYTQGNHEAGNTFEKLFTRPDLSDDYYYSFEYKNSIFICLDSEEPEDDDQLGFLENELSLHQDKTWKFVFFHRPFYTEGKHSEEMTPYFGDWWNLFDEYGVDVIMNGHIHNYTRSVPINRNIMDSNGLNIASSYGSNTQQGRLQIISGGLAGDLSDRPGDAWFIEELEVRHHYCRIDILGEQLVLKAIDEDGIVFDEVQIDKRNPL